MEPTFTQAISSDRTEIGVWREGEGPPLVLVHGTTADHTRWSRVAPRLAAAFTLFAVDRRGRGRSGDTLPYSLAQEGEDVAAVVRTAGDGVSLLGHSYGALCCIEAALQLPDLHRLVLYEPPLPLGLGLVPDSVRDQLDQLIEGGDPEGALVLFFREVVRVPEAELDVLRAHPMWPARVAAAHTIPRETSVEAEYSLDLTRLKSLRVPTLLLLGGDSPFYFREATSRLHEALPNSRVHEMPGQQHIAMDTAPEEFVDAVSSFVLSSAV